MDKNQENERSRKSSEYTKDLGTPERHSKGGIRRLVADEVVYSNQGKRTIIRGARTEYSSCLMYFYQNGHLDDGPRADLRKEAGEWVQEVYAKGHGSDGVFLYEKAARVQGQEREIGTWEQRWMDLAAACRQRKRELYMIATDTIRPDQVKRVAETLDYISTIERRLRDKWDQES